MSDSRFAEPDTRGPFLHYSGFSGGRELDADFCVVDVETTGLNADAGASIIELAAIRCDASGRVLDSMSTLVNHGSDDTGATHIHGISSSMIKDAPTFSQIHSRLTELMSGAIFVAHHAKFDESFVAVEADRAGITLERTPGLCTYWMGRELLTGVTANHKLATLAEHFSLNQGNMHAAHDDAMVVVQLLPRLIEMAEAKGKILNFYSDVVTHSSTSPSAPLVGR